MPQTIYVTQQTTFKQSTGDSSQLPPSQRLAVPRGASFEVTSYRLEFDHYRIELPGSLGGFQSWFVFNGHSRIGGDVPVTKQRATVVTQGLPLNVRSSPVIDGNVIDSLPNGTLVEVWDFQHNQDGDWRYGGRPGTTNPGWMAAQFLKLL
ncbi:hypothetical protein [Lyngbya aestuarii]|uniref:hypothetical protein n=1 Tax=Lyngbya aestuarii TaxID=118322 RepID=UPI00403DBE1A